MARTPVALPVPGWYADPAGQRALRWWDGRAWTMHLRAWDPAPVGPAPPAGPAPAPDGLRSPAVPARAAWWALAGVVAGIVASGALQGLAAAFLPGSDAVSILFGELGLWAALAGTCVLVSRRYGTGSLARDFGWRVERRDVLIGIGAGFGCLVAAALVGSAFAGSRFHGSNTQIISQQKGDTAGVVIVTLVAAVGAPLFEELFFRGFLRTALTARIGAAAVAAQALLFGLAHFQVDAGLGNVSIIAATAALGLVLGLVAHRVGRLGPGIIGHGVFNLAVTLTIVLSPALVHAATR